MKIIVLSFQGAFLQAESAQSHLTKHFEYFLVKCVPQQSRALNFKEGVLIIETSFIAKHLSVYKLFHRQTHQDHFQKKSRLKNNYGLPPTVTFSIG